MTKGHAAWRMELFGYSGILLRTNTAAGCGHEAMDLQMLEPWGPPSRRGESSCRHPCIFAVTIASSLLHAGLQLGLFGDSGTRTCGGAAASYGHEELDAQTFASWGISYLKYDNCNAVKKDK